MTDFSMLNEGVIFDSSTGVVTIEDIKKFITVHSAIRLTLTPEMQVAPNEGKSVAFDIYGDYLVVVETSGVQH